MSERSVILLFPAALLCVGEIDNPILSRLLRATALIAALAVFPIQCLRFSEFNAQAQSFQRMTAKLEPGQHAISLVSIDVENAERTQPLQHFSSWYTAEKNGWAERTTLALPHFPIHYKQVSPTEERWQIEDALKTFSWQRYPKLNYLFTYSDSAEQSNAWAAQGGAGELVAEDGKWRTYRRK